MVNDPEIKAMESVTTALEGLDMDARTRVLRWAADRFEVMTSGHIKKREKAPRMESGEHRFGDLSELYDAADPGTQKEKVLVAGYWLQEVQGKDDFEALPVNNALKNLGHGVSNITRSFSRLMDGKPRLVMQVQKQGSTKQARKRYKLTTAGVRHIEGLLEDKDS